MFDSQYSIKIHGKKIELEKKPGQVYKGKKAKEEIIRLFNYDTWNNLKRDLFEKSYRRG